MITLSAYPNILISGQIIFSQAILAFGFDEEAVWKKAADDYEIEVRRVLDKLRGWGTGRAVLKAINATPRTMLIEPLLETPGGKTNAYATPNDLKEARGKGSDTTVSFTPAHWRASGTAKSITGLIFWSGPGTLPDELLLHEMTHGLRHMAGLRMRRNVPLQQGYDTFEEWFAILVANIYRSERGRTDLRADHHGFETLASLGINSQEDFVGYRLNRQHLKKFQRQQPAFFAGLQSVEAPFNPTTLIN